MPTQRHPEQVYCPDMTDHPAHDGVAGRHGSTVDLVFVRCPGRYTPRGFTSGAYGDPKPTADPFAGIE